MGNSAAHSDGLRSLAQEGIMGATALFTMNVASTGLAALNSIIIARVLGPQGFGQYSLAMTGLNMMLLATGLGLPTAVTFYTARAVAHRSHGAVLNVLRVSLAIAVVNSILVALVGLRAFPYIAKGILGLENADWLMAFFGPLIIVAPVVSILSGMFLGLGRAAFGGATNTAREAFRLASLAIIVSYYSLSLREAVIVYLLGYIASLILAVLFSVRSLGGSGDKGGAYEVGAGGLLRYGFPFYISSVLVGALGIYQNIIMAKASSEVELAGLRVSLNLIAAIGLLTSPIYSMALPIFSKAETRGGTQRVFRLSQALSSAIVFPFVLFFAIESSRLLELFYGLEYAVFGKYFSILSLSALSIMLGDGLLAGALAGSGHPWKANSITFVELVCFLLFSYNLSSWMGPIGVVIGVTAGRWASALYAYSLSRRVLGIKIDWRANAKALIASVLSMAILLALRKAVFPHTTSVIYLGASGLSLLVLYFIFISMLRPFRDYELDFLMVSLEGRGAVFHITRLLVKLYKRLSSIFIG